MALIAPMPSIWEVRTPRRETYASTAWVIASMPVQAVRYGGMVRMSAGSTIAREEMMFGSKITILYIFWVSVMTEAQLVSEPVPAVVVMASWGTVIGFLVVHIPLNSRML